MPAALWVCVLLWMLWTCVLTLDRKSTRLNSSHLGISYAVFCLKKKKIERVLDVMQVLYVLSYYYSLLIFFFSLFNDPTTTEIYTLSVHDALPILHKTT